MNRILLPMLALGLSLALTRRGCSAKPRADSAKATAIAEIAEIKKLGGKITLDENTPGKPVCGVDLSRTQVTDAGLMHLEGFAALQALWLPATKITDARLEHLKGLTQLQRLSLRGSKVTDAGLVGLEHLARLQSLDLAHTQVTDAGLEHLQGLTNLGFLALGGTRVTDAGIEKLKLALPTCSAGLWP